MYEFFKNLADDNNWNFEYGRSDYQNLSEDIEPNKQSLFVDPIIIDSKFSETGNESITYSGRFMLLYSSDVDEDYSTKYETYIKPIVNESLQILKNKLSCSSFTIKAFKMLEVINLYDFNLDGVLINYNIELID